jgi:hypothetical protein
MTVERLQPSARVSSKAYRASFLAAFGVARRHANWAVAMAWRGLALAVAVASAARGLRVEGRARSVGCPWVEGGRKSQERCRGDQLIYRRRGADTPRHRINRIRTTAAREGLAAAVLWAGPDGDERLEGGAQGLRSLQLG